MFRIGTIALAVLASLSLPARAADPPRTTSKAIEVGFPAWSVAFADGGQTFLVAGDKDTFKVCDLMAKKVQSLRGHNQRISMVTVSADGKRWASASSDTTVVIWDAATREELFTLKGHTDVVSGVAFAPDGKTLVTGGRDNTVRLWDLGTKKEMGALHGYRWVESVVFAPDGKTIALGTADGVISFWDTPEPRKVLPTPRKHDKRVCNMAYSPDSKTVASAGEDGKVVLWDVATGQPTHSFVPCKGAAPGVAFSPDGKMLALGCGDGTVRLYDADGREEKANLKGHAGDSWVWSVCFSADGKTLASASQDGTVRIWSLAGVK